MAVEDIIDGRRKDCVTAGFDEKKMKKMISKVKIHILAEVFAKPTVVACIAHSTKSLVVALLSFRNEALSRDSISTLNEGCVW
jgi:hypothetical protein